MNELCGPATFCCVSVIGTKEVPAPLCTDPAVSICGEDPIMVAELGSSILGFLDFWRIVPVAVGVPSGFVASGDVAPKEPASRDACGVFGFFGFG